MKLRDYQKDIFDKIMGANTHDLVQLDTGGGKTPIIAALAQQTSHWLVVAHRNTLIQQASATMARFGLYHDTISSDYTRRRCMTAHQDRGVQYIVPGYHNHVASVDGILSRYKRGRLTLNRQVPWLILIDEAHHAICDNKWGKLAEIFPNARFVGFTATPARNDGRSLHADYHGLFDRLVQAEGLQSGSVKKLIEWGHLADFDVYAPAASYKVSFINKDDPNGPRLQYDARSWRVDGTLVFGDILGAYKRLIGDRRTVVMLPRISIAEQFAESLKDEGYTSAAVHCKMPQTETYRRIDAFRRGEFQFLCNVDIVNEGFDLPEIEAISLLRKTQSTVLYRQWVGRTLRSAPGKRAVIIDHVGNVFEHGLPDRDIDWSQSFIKPPNGQQLISCPECEHVFNVYRAQCPACGWIIDPDTRNSKAGIFSAKNVNWKLVKQERDQVLQQQKEQAEAERMAAEIILPASGRLNAQGAVGRACLKIRDWIAEQAAGRVDNTTINSWLRSDEANDKYWYMKRFTIADVAKEAPNKAEKAIREWQRKQETR